MRQKPTISRAIQLRKEGHSRPAEQMADAVHRAEPRNVDALALLIEFAKARGDYAATDRFARQALALRPNDAYFKSVIAENWFQRGDPTRAIEECDRALVAHPGEETFIRIKALSHEVRQEFAEAMATLGPLILSQTPSAEALAIAGRALHGLERFDDAVGCMLPAASDARHSESARQRLWFQLAKTYDRIGEFNHAMEAAQNAHSLAKGSFDPSASQAIIDELIDVFSPSNLRGLARSSNRSELPVFVIGMPRSGTTLVEQIIQSHPSAFGAGELPDIELLTRSVQLETGSIHTYPNNVVDMTSEVAGKLAARYVARLSSSGGNATRVVDKMLEQYLHVGLIWMLLPAARVVHVRRDPMDTCLSCYTRHLNSNRMTYARNLEHLGLVYRQHDRLMKHWEATLDLRFLTVQYEELVADQERISRRIIEFLGLPWDDRCLRYWESDRTAMTLSYDQVNRPVYDSSIGRWRNYERYLGPLKAALEASS